MRILLTLLVFLYILELSCSNAKEVPVIGILSKPVYSSVVDIEDEMFLDNDMQVMKNNSTSDETGKRFIDGTYVNFLEAGGAKVAYIDYRASNEELTELFKKLDGMLIPGGGVYFWDGNKLSEFALSAKHILELAIEENDKGGYFPIWGTCLGFELILQLVGVNNVLSSECNCKNYGTTLEFSDKAKSSRLFAHYTTEQMYNLAAKPYTYNNHQLYVSLKSFYSNTALSSFFNVLATSKDKGEKMSYIAAVEAKKYPIYAVQFHPEKNAYMSDPITRVDHSKESIEIMQQMSTFFVEECRKSKHKFKDIEEEAKHVVYNGELVFNGIVGPEYHFS